MESKAEKYKPGGGKNLRNRSKVQGKKGLLSQQVETHAMATNPNNHRINGDAETQKQLSPFEITVMSRLSYGARNSHLAQEYNTTTDAIEWHRKQLIKKLGAAHIIEAVAIGLRKKIIE